MINTEDIIQFGKTTIKHEIQEVSKLVDYIDEKFAEAVNLIYKAKGRIIVSGIGKSANIANKIVATFNSTGTPSIFMHAADAIHGDLGIIQKDDVVILISKSGNTPEIKMLLPLIKASRQNKIIAIVGNMDSYLAQQSDISLNTTIATEACPNNLAPTSSTTAQLIMGDALAVSLLKIRDFSSEDFAKYHPGGTLGKRLYLRAGDIATTTNLPTVGPQSSIREIIMEISSKRLGAAVVLEGEEIIGIITDGDLRRMMQMHDDVDPLKASDIMSKNPKSVDFDTLAADTLVLMKEYNITQLILTKEQSLFGIIHLHDILKEGII